MIPYLFNAATMTAFEVSTHQHGERRADARFYVERSSALVNPNVVYGAVSGANNRTIST